MFNKLAVKAQLLIADVREGFSNATKNERGDLMQTVLLIALFAVAVIIIGGIIINALTEQAGNIEDCITGIDSSSCGVNP